MKKLLLAAVGFISTSALFAAPLTPEQALQRTISSGPERSAAKNYNVIPAMTVLGTESTPALYVFTGKDGNGFLLAAADDIAYPVLGYSDNGNFDVNNLPVSLGWWLQEYARQISWASEKGAKSASTKFNSSKPAVNPLVKSQWNQDSPYNDLCPTPKNSDEKCVSGCVATSMAQVMNYFKYPDVGTGTIKYTASSINKMLVLNLAREEFDWNNMLNVYSAGKYTETQGHAVAYLMKACGYSVEMNYGVEASGAQGIVIASALRKWFTYDDNCRSEMRLLYSSEQWEDMIYNNLKNVGPVIINGRSPQDGGHSFICDGYDGNGYYHFNWGWGGISDGFYSLDALNPDAQGIGGYAGGFNFNQNAIIGIQPPTGQPANDFCNTFLLYGNLDATIADGKIKFVPTDYSPSGWGNATDHSITALLGAKFEPADGSGATQMVDVTLSGSNEVTIGSGSYYNTTVNVYAAIPSMTNGVKYKVTIMSKAEGEDWKPLLTPWGYHNYIYITKNGNSYTIESVPAPKLNIVKAELDSELYFKKNVKIAVTLTNNSDVELSQGIAAYLYQGDVCKQQGGSVLVNVPANSTVVKEFVTKFDPNNGVNVTEDTQYTLRLMNPQTNAIYGDYGTVTMKPAPAQTSVMLTKLDVPGAEKIEGDYGGRPRVPFLVEDPSKLTVDLDYTVRYGYFDGQITMGIFEVDPKTNDLIPVIDDIYSEMPFLSGGESSSIHTIYDFSQADPNKLYNIKAVYYLSSRSNLMGTIAFVTNRDAVGVDNVFEDIQEPVKYYNLQGNEVKNPQKGELVIQITGGKQKKIVVK